MTKTGSVILEQLKTLKNNFFCKIKNKKVFPLDVSIRGKIKAKRQQKDDPKQERTFR